MNYIKGRDKMIIKKEESQTKTLVLRQAEPADYEEILRMNKESVQFLSTMDLDRLKVLEAESDLLWVAEVDSADKGDQGPGQDEKLGAFIIAFREGADYDSVNYQWFEKNFAKFLYIDRVVVDLGAREIGLGKLIYDAIFEYAKASGVDKITAEIDIQPENPISLKFHQKYDFEEVGRQEVAGGTKVVSLQTSQVK